MSILRFPERRATRLRACQGCGERFPRTAPHYWRYCSKCYGYGLFRRAVEAFRTVRP